MSASFGQGFEGGKSLILLFYFFLNLMAQVDMEHLTIHIPILSSISHIAWVLESFVHPAVHVNNMCCCFIWNIVFSLHVFPSWRNKSICVVPGNVAELRPIVHGMTRWLCFVKWQIHQVLQSHNPNCTIPQKGFTGFASATNDSCSSPAPKEKKWDNKTYRWSLPFSLITKFVVHLRCQSRHVKML